MRIALLILAYIAAFLAGCRMLRGKEKKRHRLGFGLILLWCVYLNLSGMTNTPHLSISSPYIAYFQPVGRMIIKWLGG